jgi:hypothetical protein
VHEGGKELKVCHWDWEFMACLNLVANYALRVVSPTSLIFLILGGHYMIKAIELEKQVQVCQNTEMGQFVLI